MLQRVGWMTVVLGVVLAALFVSGVTHPVSAQVPSTVASYDSHHRWVVAGFAVSMIGAAMLLVTETIRGRRKAPEATPADTPADEVPARPSGRHRGATVPREQRRTAASTAPLREGLP